MKHRIEKTLVFVDDGAINGNGNVYRKGSIRLDKNPIPLTINFKDEIGQAFITREPEDKDKVYAELIVETQNKDILNAIIGAFPSIRGRVEKTTNHGTILNILSVGVCFNPNSDSRIGPLKREEIIPYDDTKEAQD